MIANGMIPPSCHSPTEVAEWATSPPPWWPDDVMIKPSVVEQAVTNLLRRGLIQFLTKEAILEIQELISEEESIGPLWFCTNHDMDEFIDTLDFTWAGAVIWEGLERVVLGKVGGSFLVEEGVGARTVTRNIIGTDVADVENLLQKDLSPAEQTAPKTMGGPSPVGPWRSHWWRFFQFGYAASVTLHGTQ